MSGELIGAGDLSSERSARRGEAPSRRRTGGVPLLPYLLLLPSVLFLGFVFLVPLVETALVAFSEGGEWSLNNFRRMADDLNFDLALRNTLLLVALVVPLQLAMALAMATLLQGARRGREMLLYIFTIPLGISDLAAGIAWLALLTENGYLNTALDALGLIDGPTLWLSYERPIALFTAVLVAELWRATAIVLIILVAGLQLIPREYAEAAEIFGAGPWRRFWRVTLPLLKPSIQAALILRTILAFEVFAMVIAIGGRNLPVLIGEAYAWRNEYQDTGVATAYALLILGLSIAATLLYLSVLRVREEAPA